MQRVNKNADKSRDSNSSRLNKYWNVAPDQLLSDLRSTMAGLSQVEADRSLKEYGPNSIKSSKPNSVIGLLLSQFKSPLVLILVVAAAISAMAGEWQDATIVLAIVIGSTMLGFWQCCIS